MLDLAFSEEAGRNHEDGARVLAKVVDLLARYEALLDTRKAAKSDASLVFDVVARVYRLVEKGSLKSEQDVRAALSNQGRRLGFELDQDALNDFVALRDEIVGKGGAVDAAVTAFAARTGRTKRAVYKRVGAASSRALRKRGLFSATSPSRMRYWTGDFVNLGLYAMDVLSEVALSQLGARETAWFRAARQTLLAHVSGEPLAAAVAPPPPWPPRTKRPRSKRPGPALADQARRRGKK